MLDPELQVIKTLFWIYTVDEDANLHIPDKKVSQLVEFVVASSIPDVKLDIKALTTFFDVDDAAKVWQHGCGRHGLLRSPLYEGLDNASFTDWFVAHENDLCDFHLRLARFGPRRALWSVQCWLRLHIAWAVPTGAASTAARSLLFHTQTEECLNGKRKIF